MEQILTAVVGANISEFTSKMSQVTSKIKGVSSSFSSNMSNMANAMKPISAGILALGTTAITASEQMKSGVNTFKTNLGATGSDLSALEQSMKNVSASGVGSFNEIADSMVSIKQNMKGISGKELETVTEQSMQLAKVMDTDVGEVTRATGMLMKQFGVDSNTALDLVAKGFQNGLNVDGEMLDNIREYSVQFKSMGFSAEEMMNMVSAGMDNGAWSLDKLMDGVKEFNLRAGDGSKSTTEAFQSLGLDAEELGTKFNNGGKDAQQAFTQTIGKLSELDDATQRNAISTALFGTQYEDLQGGLQKALGNSKNYMEGFRGSAEKVAKDNQSFTQMMSGAWNSVSIALAPIGTKLVSMIGSILPPIVSTIKKVGEWFNKLPDGMQTAVVAFGAILAIIPIVLVALAGIGSTISFVATGLSGLGTIATVFGTTFGILKNVFSMVALAFKGLRLMFATNPFGLIILALTILVPFIIKHWDTIKQYTLVVWNGIKSMLSAVWEGIKAVAIFVFNALKAYFTFVFNFYKTIILAVWNGIKTALMAIWNGIKAVAMFVFNALKAYFTFVFNLYKTIITKVWNGIKTALLAIWNGIKSVAMSVFNAIKTVISTVFNAVKTKMITIWNGIKTTMVTIWNGIKTNATNAFNGVKNAILNPITKAKDKISSIIKTIKGFFTNLKLKIPTPSMPKLPHFNLKMGSKSIMGKKISYPTGIGVNWYKTGGIFDGASVIGVGEEGTEAVVPLSNKSKMKPFAQAVSSMMDTENNTNANNTGEGAIYELTINVPLDGKTIAKQTVRFTKEELDRFEKKNNRLNGLK